MPRHKGKRAALAIDVWGDFAHMTVWMNRRAGYTHMVKSPPKECPTTRQIAWRKFFQNGFLAWKALTIEQRQAYEDVSHMLHFIMTGYNFWMHCYLKDRWDDAQAANNITGAGLYIP